MKKKLHVKTSLDNQPVKRRETPNKQEKRESQKEKKKKPQNLRRSPQIYKIQTDSFTYLVEKGGN